LERIWKKPLFLSSFSVLKSPQLVMWSFYFWIGNTFFNFLLRNTFDIFNDWQSQIPALMDIFYFLPAG